MSTPNPVVAPTPVPAPEPIKPEKPKYLSPAFYVTLATYIIPILTLAYHRDFSPLVPAVSVFAAGLATAAYTIYMAIKTHAFSQQVIQYNKISYLHYALASDRAAA